MNQLTINTLKALRKIYTKIFRVHPMSKPKREENPDKVSQLIYDKLINDEPCMIARFGAFELTTVVDYIGIRQKEKSIWKYIKGESLSWWWNKKTMAHMQNNAGFFPSTKEKLTQFCELILNDIREVDVLGSWLPNENYVLGLMKEPIMVQLETLNPFFAKSPWTKVLENKKVLVVHPFANLIKQQYSENREYLFGNKEILPLFRLETIPAVQSLGGNNNDFKDWFKALQWMKDEIDKHDYDICLIGCGAYGFPLAAHVRRMGKKSVHLGGALQLLFGIKGKRWEDPNYNEKYNYAALMNKYWVKPGENEKPTNASDIEGGCYW